MNEVEIIYCPRDAAAVCYHVCWTSTMCVQHAIEQTTILQQYPELAQCSVGIFSQIVSRETPVNPGDRIELYRPLRRDPKEKRRLSARITRSEKQGRLNHSAQQI